MRDRENEIYMLQDTLEILEKGWYEKDGERKRLKLSREEMEEVRVFFPNEVGLCGRDPYFVPKKGTGGRCRYSCQNMDSYTLARRRAEELGTAAGEDARILVLNLANATNPGGGVRRGARAQEEDLCRKSSLLVSLESMGAYKYYSFNRNLHTQMGSDALMITPKVEIIKDESGNLLDETVVVSVLTCAAPNIKYGKGRMSEAQYEEMFCNRIMGMLACAAHMRYRNLVLGALGCGAFANDARLVSDLFRRALRDLNINGSGESELFDRIDFAVLDRTREKYNFREFSRNFA